MSIISGSSNDLSKYLQRGQHSPGNILLPGTATSWSLLVSGAVKSCSMLNIHHNPQTWYHRYLFQHLLLPLEHGTIHPLLVPHRSHFLKLKRNIEQTYIQHMLLFNFCESYNMFLLEVNAQKRLIKTSSNHIIVATSRNVFSAVVSLLQKQVVIWL